ncbi:MAG: ABC transporter permease, partial [Methanospirillaceae archaeon]|nr:ABC transporter permease [Methanospirillaceae archaeon]
GKLDQYYSVFIQDNTIVRLHKKLKELFPAPRESILFGKILVIMIRGLIQSTIILALAFLIGATLYTPTQLAVTYLILIVFGALLSSFTTTLAIYVGDHDSYAAVSAMISMPLFFTSTAMMPYDVMPEWLRIPAALNPLSFAIDGIRLILEDVFPAIQISALCILCILLMLISVRAFRRVKI